MMTTIITRDVPDTEFAGYPACRISGRSESRIPDIRLDRISGRISGFLKKKIVWSATSH